MAPPTSDSLTLTTQHEIDAGNWLWAYHLPPHGGGNAAPVTANVGAVEQRELYFSPSLWADHLAPHGGGNAAPVTANVGAIEQEQELVLSSTCSGCGATGDLYGSNCNHKTLCLACGKRLAESKAPCADCGLPVTRLIQEYTVRPLNGSKQQFVGTFRQGMPVFPRKKPCDARWAMQREGLQGRQLTKKLREKYKGKPWVLEDYIGQQQFQGRLEGGQRSTFYMLVHHGRDIIASHINSWYNFQKVPQYKQLTLEEAEKQMRKRKKTADGSERRLVKVARTGAAAFNDIENVGGARSRAKGGEDDENDESDHGEDEDDEKTRKDRLGMDRGAQTGDEDEEEPARHVELDDDEPEKGDDWEHEENFTDDEEVVGDEEEEAKRKEFLKCVHPKPRQMKQEVDEAEGEEWEMKGGGRLSKKLKQFLGGSAGLDQLVEEEEEEENDDPDLETEEIGLSPLLLPSKKVSIKEEVTKISSTKVAAPSSAASRANPATASKGKRKSIVDEGQAALPPPRKRKNEQPQAAKAVVASVKEESPAKAVAGEVAAPDSAASRANFATTSKGKRKLIVDEGKAALPPSRKRKTEQPQAAKAVVASVKEESPPKAVAAVAATPAQPKSSATNGKGGISEEEVKNFLCGGPVKYNDVIAEFRSRLESHEDKILFADIVKKFSELQKMGGIKYNVLRPEFRTERFRNLL